MTGSHEFFLELKRRNVLRAAVLYVGAVWALAQGIAQLGPSFGAPGWITRWFVIACIIGFPFWLVIAWFYEITPGGLKRESDIAPDESIALATGRKLDLWIIGVLAVAVVLLIANQFVLRRDATSVAAAVDTKAALAALAAVPAKSVAVLPLANESGDPKQQYFSDGLSEELIADLTQIDGLKVIGKSSSFRFRDSKASTAQIAARLGVAHLIEGSVRQSGDTLRVRVSLIAARDGSNVWAHTYDKPMRDVFAIQTQIGEAVAKALKIKLLGKPIISEERPASGNIDAYRLMLQGRAISRRANSYDDFRRAIKVLNKAVKLDPGYAYAWGVLSNEWINLSVSLQGAEQQLAYAKARAAVEHEATLAPDTASTHRHRGYLLAMVDGDQMGALAEFRRALTLAPRDGNAKSFLALQLSLVGQLQSAADLQRQALATDPMRPDWYGNLADILIPLGEYDAAEQALREALSLQPDFPGAYAGLTEIDILRGYPAAAARDAAKESDPQYRAMALTEAALAGIDRAKADAALHAYIEKYGKIWPYSVASLYAQNGEADAMFMWLNRAGQRAAPNLLIDPFALRYKDDPRFTALCNKLGLPVPGTPLPASPTLSSSAGAP